MDQTVPNLENKNEDNIFVNEKEFADWIISLLQEEENTIDLISKFDETNIILFSKNLVNSNNLEKYDIIIQFYYYLSDKYILMFSENIFGLKFSEENINLHYENSKLIKDTKYYYEHNIDYPENLEGLELLLNDLEIKHKCIPLDIVKKFHLLRSGIFKQF